MLRTPLSCPPAGLCRYTAPCTLAGEGWPVQVFLDGNFLLQRLAAPWIPRCCLPGVWAHCAQRVVKGLRL